MKPMRGPLVFRRQTYPDRTSLLKAVVEFCTLEVPLEQLAEAEIIPEAQRCAILARSRGAQVTDGDLIPYVKAAVADARATMDMARGT